MSISFTNRSLSLIPLEDNGDNVTGGTIDPDYGCPWRKAFHERESALIERWKEGGLFVDEDLKEINCHWLQFESAPLAHHLILALIFFIISGIGCTCNAIVVYLLATSRHLRTPANILIMNVAASDFLMLVKMPVFIYNSIAQGPSLGYIGCKVYGFLSGLAGCSSIMSLAAVAAERCWVISRPLPKANINQQSGSGSRNCRWVYWLILFIWIYSATFSALPLFGIGKYVPEGYLTSCSFDYLSEDPTTQLFILVIFIAYWVVPLTIIAVSYVLIVHYVQRAVREMPVRRHPQNYQDNNAAAAIDTEDQQRHQHQRTKWLKCLFFELPTAKITLGLVVLWISSWTPYATVALLGISGYQHRLTPMMTMLPALFAKISACINPFVYSLTHPKMKKEMIRRYHRWALRATDTSDATSNRLRSGRGETRRALEEASEENYITLNGENQQIVNEPGQDIPMLPINLSSTPTASQSIIAETDLLSGQLTSDNDEGDSASIFSTHRFFKRRERDRNVFSETDDAGTTRRTHQKSQRFKDPPTATGLVVTFQDSKDHREGLGKFKVESVLTSTSPSQPDGNKDGQRWCQSSIITSSSCPNSDLKVDISFRSGIARRSSIDDEAGPTTTKATVHCSIQRVVDDGDVDDGRYNSIPFLDDSTIYSDDL